MANIDIVSVLAVAGFMAAGGLAVFFGWRWLQARLEAHRHALQDSLTGLMNDRAFAKRVGDGLDGASEPSGEFAFLMYDIDGLDAINDRFGREFGDFVLRLFAQKAQVEIRADDLLFRLGEDEFCSILPGTPQEDARAIAERIRAAFAAKPLRARKKQNVRPTVSVGLASSSVVGFRIDRLRAAAEAALDEAKRQGRDRLEIYRAPSVGDRSAA